VIFISLGYALDSGQEITMIKKLLAVAALVAVGTGSAFAADMAPRYTKAPMPMAAPYYDWSGFYIGVNLGGFASGGSVTTDPSDAIGTGGTLVNSADHFRSGVTGGVQGGYNWQVTPSWLLGLEADINWMGSKRSYCDINDCSTNSPLIVSTRTDFLSTVRGRLGYTWDRSMLYVTGGVAFARVNDSFTFFSNTDIAANTDTRVGYAVGAGIETALWSNLSVKAEYLFADVGTNRVNLSAIDGPGFLDFKHEYHIGRIGLNYRFGGPVVAKY
jgi:outer membrane immunogenic protein